MGVKETSGTERFNMAFYYLETIGILLRNYIEFRYNDDFDNMYITLDNLETLMSPKTDNDEIEKNLKWLEDNLGRWRVLNAEGAVVRVIPEYKIKIRQVLNSTFKMILYKLDKKEMLTAKMMDVSQAMREFD